MTFNPLQSKRFIAPLMERTHRVARTLDPLKPVGDSVSFGSLSGDAAAALKARVPAPGRWRRAVENSWHLLREGIVPNAVLTGILVAGSAVVASLPVLASAVVPVFVAPTFFLACCVSDGLRGLVFGAFPKLDPGHWIAKGWQGVTSRLSRLSA